MVHRYSGSTDTTRSIVTLRNALRIPANADPRQPRWNATIPGNLDPRETSSPLTSWIFADVNQDNERSKREVAFPARDATGFRLTWRGEAFSRYTVALITVIYRGFEEFPITGGIRVSPGSSLTACGQATAVQSVRRILQSGRHSRASHSTSLSIECNTRSRRNSQATQESCALTSTVVLQWTDYLRLINVLHRLINSTAL